MLVAKGTDGRSLAMALDLVLERIQKPAEYQRLAEQGLSLIERRYTWARHCAELAALLGGPVLLKQAA